MENETKDLAVIDEKDDILRPADLNKVAEALRQFDAAKKAVLRDIDYQEIQGKNFVKKSGWRRLARAFVLSTEIIDKKVVRDDDGRVQAAEFVVRASHPNGAYMEAWGGCDIYEKNKRFDKGQDVVATAQTRATNRAISDLIAGGEVSADEMSTGGKPYSTSTQTQTQPAQSSPPPDAKALQKAEKLRAILMPDYTGEWPPLGEERNGKRWPINIATAKTFSQKATKKQIDMIHKVVAELGYNANDDQRYDLLKALYVMYEVPAEQRVLSMAADAFTKGHASWFIEATKLIRRKEVDDPVPWPTKPKPLQGTLIDEDHIGREPQTEADLKADPGWDADLDADIDTGDLDKEPHDG